MYTHVSFNIITVVNCVVSRVMSTIILAMLAFLGMAMGHGVLKAPTPRSVCYPDTDYTIGAKSKR